MTKTIVAVDFDGTLCEHEYPEIGLIKHDIADLVRKLHAMGVVIILWTCRHGKELEDALAFCKKYSIPIDHANENWKYLPFETSAKIYADFYIDDRAHPIYCPALLDKIKNYKPDPFIV